MKKSLAILSIFVLSSLNLFAQSYVSPFKIELSKDIESWTSDFAERTAQIISNSSPAPNDWYSANPISQYGPNNPQLYSSSSIPNTTAFPDRGAPVYNVTNNFSAPKGVSQTMYDQERLLYAAKELIGTHYQHDHLPQFNGGLNPYYNWQGVTTNEFLQSSVELTQGTTSTIVNPYKAEYAKATNGIDCTDFSAYIYNLALGIQMYSGTPTQIQFVNGGVTNSFLTNSSIPTATIFSSTGAQITPKFIESPNFGTTQLNAPGSLSNVLSQLQPGDLLYMRGASDDISHVVVWLGYYGINADGTPSDVPLVISSHDNTPAIFNTTNINSSTGLPSDLVINGSSNNITDFLPPPGVEILPFATNTWFYNNFSVAMQVISVPEPSSNALLILAMLALLAIARSSNSKKTAN